MISDVERASEDSIWLTVKGFSVRVLSTAEGVLVDIWPLGKEDAESVASTYAFDTEIEGDLP